MNRAMLKEKMNEDINLISEIADNTRVSVEDDLIRASLILKSRCYVDMTKDDYITLIGEVFNDLRCSVTIKHIEGLTASLEAINTKLLSVEKEMK